MKKLSVFLLFPCLVLAHLPAQAGWFTNKLTLKDARGAVMSTLDPIMKTGTIHPDFKVRPTFGYRMVGLKGVDISSGESCFVGIVRHVDTYVSERFVSYDVVVTKLGFHEDPYSECNISREASCYAEESRAGLIGTATISDELVASGDPANFLKNTKGSIKYKNLKMTVKGSILLAHIITGPTALTPMEQEIENAIGITDPSRAIPRRQLRCEVDLSRQN